jgi:AcrR family transcriptional regulator
MVVLVSQPAKPAGSAYERILATASDLFYRNGYRATGINEVIEKSGVAKATFYKHFPTKDDLCLVYLRERNERELAEIQAFVESQNSVWARFMAPVESLGPWFLDSGMKGCAFLNMVPEVPESDSPLRKEGAIHYARLHALISKLAAELIASDTDRHEHLDPDRLASNYMVIFTGAIALAGIRHDIEPVRQGIEAVKNLIK